MNKKLAATSSAIITAILSAVILVEGGYTDDPYDPGGKTKYGITENVAREYGYTGRIEDLTKEMAIEIYETLYVREPHFDLMIDVNPAIAHKLIDAGVNVGTARVSLWFQRILNNLSNAGKLYPLISEDGMIGPKTIASYKALESIRGKEKACTLVLKSLDGYQTYYYSSLTELNRYLAGWLDKRIGNISLSQCTNYNLHIPFLIEEDESK